MIWVHIDRWKQKWLFSKNEWEHCTDCASVTRNVNKACFLYGLTLEKASVAHQLFMFCALFKETEVFFIFERISNEDVFSAFSSGCSFTSKKDKQSLSSAAQTPWQVNYTQLLTCIFFTCVIGCVCLCVILLFSSMHKHTLRCFAAISAHMLFYGSVCARSFGSFNALVICLCSRGPRCSQTVL